MSGIRRVTTNGVTTIRTRRREDTAFSWVVEIQRERRRELLAAFPSETRANAYVLHVEQLVKAEADAHTEEGGSPTDTDSTQ